VAKGRLVLSVAFTRPVGLRGVSHAVGSRRNMTSCAARVLLLESQATNPPTQNTRGPEEARLGIAVHTRDTTNTPQHLHQEQQARRAKRNSEQPQRNATARNPPLMKGEGKDKRPDATLRSTTTRSGTARAKTVNQKSGESGSAVERNTQQCIYSLLRRP